MAGWDGQSLSLLIDWVGCGGSPLIHPSIHWFVGSLHCFCSAHHSLSSAVLANLSSDSLTDVLWIHRWEGFATSRWVDGMQPHLSACLPVCPLRGVCVCVSVCVCADLRDGGMRSGEACRSAGRAARQGAHSFLVCGCKIRDRLITHTHTHTQYGTQ